MTWVLVLIAILTSPTMVYIPGYPDKDACDRAGKAFKDEGGWSGGARMWTCIPGPAR